MPSKHPFASSELVFGRRGPPVKPCSGGCRWRAVPCGNLVPGPWETVPLIRQDVWHIIAPVFRRRLVRGVQLQKCPSRSRASSDLVHARPAHDVYATATLATGRLVLFASGHPSPALLVTRALCCTKPPAGRHPFPASPGRAGGSMLLPWRAGCPFGSQAPQINTLTASTLLPALTKGTHTPAAVMPATASLPTSCTLPTHPGPRLPWLMATSRAGVHSHRMPDPELRGTLR